MFVEKIILEELNEDGYKWTTIIENTEDIGRPLLIDYADYLTPDHPNAQYGPYVLIGHDQSRKDIYDPTTYKSRLESGSFKSTETNSFEVIREWSNISVLSDRGHGIIYALRLPPYANIDELSIEVPYEGVRKRIIKDLGLNSNFISLAVNPYPSSSVSFTLKCKFAIDQDRFQDDTEGEPAFDEILGSVSLDEDTRKTIQDLLSTGSKTSRKWFIFLNKHFNLEEFRTLCFEMEIDYESLGGEGKSAKIREFVVYLARHNKFSDLSKNSSVMNRKENKFDNDE